MLEALKDPQTGLRMLDFVKRRDVGPGKLRQNGELEGFNFAEGERFGEETAALWDEDRGWLLVQFNLHGVRAGAIAGYLNSYDADPESDWQLVAKMDPRAEAELRQRPFIRAAAMKFRTSDVLHQAIRDGGAGLGDALSHLGPQAGSAHIEVKFSMGHAQGFLSPNIGEMMQSLRRYMGKEDGLTSMKIVARQAPDASDRAIDLLRHRIKAAYSSNELEVQDGRYTLKSRWHLLVRIHRGWAQEF